jgi:hypothetical protein
MKKYLLVCVAAAMTLTAVKGQTGESVKESPKESFKPKKGSIALEAGFSPFAVDGNNIYLQQGQIRAVYTVSEKIGIRLGLGFNTVSASDDNGQVGDAWQSETKNSSAISFSPGLVYSLSGTEKLTPYFGAELVFATSSNTSITEGRNSKTIVRNDGEIFNTIGVGVFSGFNYYFAKNLYAGVELGIEIDNRSLKNMVTETTTSATTETIELKNEVRVTTVETVFNPAIRLGWVF